MLSTSTLNNIENELVIGLAGGLGVNFDEVSKALEKTLKDAGYHVVIVRVSENFTPRENDSGFSNCYWKMQYGTKQRQINGNDYWAKKAVEKIFFLRPDLSSDGHTRIAYVVRSLKNKEELELLASVYGKNFISIAIFSDADLSLKFLEKTLKLSKTTLEEAQQEMHSINSDLGLNDDLDIPNISEVLSENGNTLAKFLMRKDQQETHPDLHSSGQNLFQCYSRANFFVYQNQNLSQQMIRFIHIVFNDPFAEPTFEEYFMFCAQAAAYRSLDLDRQVGAVIVNKEYELVAVGFNDVSKVGGGHFAHHNHPMNEDHPMDDYRDFKQQYDYNHIHLDQIAKRIAEKLHLPTKDQNLLREEISGITEFKRSTHAEMSALLDAARRGIAIRDCTIYVNTYPCHTCTKHIIAAGIKKVVFLYPYTKSKAREMYTNMIKHALLLDKDIPDDVVVFEPFLGVSPNYFMSTFANDKETRLEKVGGKETGKTIKWEITKETPIRSLEYRQPYTYISREWVIVHNKFPDISVFYKPGFMG